MAEANPVLDNPGRVAAREQDLIARVQRGQNELFYELVKPYERRVYAAALAILRNENDAEDVAQESVLKALANIRQFRAEARFSTWLIQITVNEALMRRRRERTVVMEGLDDRRDEETDYTPRDFADWREIPSEALERKEVRQKLAEALASLDILEEKEVEMMNLALARIDAGDYLICASCGKRISLRRLHALPWTTYCACCAKQQEARLVTSEKPEPSSPELPGRTR